MSESAVHIHHLCKKFVPIKGGVEVVVDSICRASDSSDMSISSTIVTCDASPHAKFEYDYANVVRVKSYGELFSHPLSLRIMNQIFRSLRHASIVYVHYPFPIADVVIGLLGWFKRSRVIVYWHSNIVSQRLLRWLFFPFTFLMLAQAENILVATPEGVKYSALLRWFEKKIKVIPYGLDDNSSSYAIGDEGYFLAIGRHVSYKGFDVLIKAMLNNTEKLKIIGDGPLFEEHLELIMKLGISERVELIRSSSNTERDEILALCRALVLPSVYPSEAFALVQLEAMKFAKPIINTKLESGVPWVARDGIEAISVMPGSVSELMSAIKKIGSDDEFRDRLSLKARARYLDLFTSRKFVDAIKNVNA